MRSNSAAEATAVELDSAARAAVLLGIDTKVAKVEVKCDSAIAADRGPAHRTAGFTVRHHRPGQRGDDGADRKPLMPVSRIARR
jgi:hypothetical protein